jgi:hypothetical protein
VTTRAAAAALGLLPGLLFLAFSGDAVAGRLLPSPLQFLRTDAGFSAVDIGSMEQGRVLAKVVDTGDNSEVFVVGAMKVHTTPARVLAQVREFEGRRRPGDILQAGKLSSPATAADLAGLSLDAADLAALGKCRPNDCDERLPAEAMQRFHDEVDWKSRDRAAKGAAWWRETLAGFATAYEARGNAGLVQYDNNDMPVKLGDSVAKVLARSDYIAESAPALYRYLESFPKDPPAGIEEYLYWLKERFWIKTVVSMNHVLIATGGDAVRPYVLAAAKQIYANHYFESSLSITVYIQTGGGGYLVYLSRTRADIRASGFNFLERVLLRRLVVARLDSQLKWMRAVLEGAPPGAATEAAATP